MTSTLWKRLGAGAVALTIVGAGLALSLPDTDAASIDTIGTVEVCTGDKSHLLALVGGPLFDVHTSGFLAAGVGPSFVTTDGRQGTSLTVEDVFSSGHAEGLGSVTFNLDTRPAGPSSLIANQRSSRFPATQTMRFHFTVTTDIGTFRSANAATVSNSEVQAFPPPPGTVYVLTNEVQLEDVNKPGATAASLAPGRAFTVR